MINLKWKEFQFTYTYIYTHRHANLILPTEQSFFFFNKLLSILGQLLSLSYFAHDIFNHRSVRYIDSSQSFVHVSIFKLLFFEQTKKCMNGMRADREREREEKKVTSRPLGKRVARKTKIDLVNRFDNRWQSVERNISIEWNLFNQEKI